MRKDMLAAAFEGDVPSSETLLRTLNSSTFRSSSAPN